MKMLRKNIDLDTKTIAILQIEATLKGHGSLKPFLESLLKDYSTKCLKSRPAVYKSILANKLSGKK